MKGLSKDVWAAEKVKRAILCKMFKCTPSQLDLEDSEDLEVLSCVYSLIGEKNPLYLL